MNMFEYFRPFESNVEGLSISLCEAPRGSLFEWARPPGDQKVGGETTCWPIVCSGKLSAYNVDNQLMYNMHPGDVWQEWSLEAFEKFGGEGEKFTDPNSVVIRATGGDCAWYSLIPLEGYEFEFTNHLLKAEQTVSLEQGEYLFIAYGEIAGHVGPKIIHKGSEHTVVLAATAPSLCCVFSLVDKG